MDNNLAVELAQLREQMKGIAVSVESIKESVSQIMTMDKSIAELLIHTEQVKKEAGMLWDRVDELKQWDIKHDHESGLKQAEVNVQISLVDSKIEAVVNKGRGALWIGSMLFIVVQGLIVGSISWIFTNTSDTISNNKVITYRLEQLEKAVKK